MYGNRYEIGVHVIDYRFVHAPSSSVYGGGQRPDMALHRMIAAARGGPAFPLFRRPVPVDRQPGHAEGVRRTGGDTSKACELLGWEPQVGLRDGIGEQVRHAAG